MPIYEYRCEACGNELEVSQRIVDPPLKECPECHELKLERLISNTSFMLKGSGWYKDGYGTKKGDKGERTENQRIDRLTKAVDEDKKSTAAADSTSPSSPATDSSSPSGGGSSGGGGDGGSSGGGGSSAAA